MTNISYISAGTGTYRVTYDGYWDRDERDAFPVVEILEHELIEGDPMDDPIELLETKLLELARSEHAMANDQVLTDVRNLLRPH